MQIAHIGTEKFLKTWLTLAFPFLPIYNDTSTEGEVVGVGLTGLVKQSQVLVKNIAFLTIVPSGNLAFDTYYICIYMCILDGKKVKLVLNSAQTRLVCT